MSLIYCSVNDYDKHINLYKQEDNGMITILDTIDYNALIETIPIICENNNIYNLHLFGTQSYLDEIVKEIEKNEIIKYNKNKINIEVN